MRLTTVCDGAACPNRGECFSRGTATFMIMGRHCTRNCQFCAVSHQQPEPLADDEPQRLAQAVKELGLRHVVITSVTRDDLPDGGADHFARTIQAVRELTPQATIEVLTPDFLGDSACLDKVHAAWPDVFNHNLETTRRLTPTIRSNADYDRSLGVLRYLAGKNPHPIVKSGFMLGLGETDEEITELLRDLRHAGVEMVTIGQYLRPSKQNHPVVKYYHPDEFTRIKEKAEALGFAHVAAGPFVRSSYHAEMSLRESHSAPAQPTTLRVIVDGPLPGDVNMARDEAILLAVQAGQAPPTLRFYQWDNPTISLGYLQKYQDVSEQDEAIQRMPVVRRQTGGGAILHDQELTYSLVLPLNGELPHTEMESLYRLAHDAFIKTLAEFGIKASYRGGDDRGNAQRGPFFCFARTHRLDLVVGPDKLLGSAQRRVKNAVLQHGSLILVRRFEQQPSAAAATLAGKPINIRSLIAKVTHDLCESLKLSATDHPLTENEAVTASDLQAKYAGKDWNYQR